jgi:hypothetical protein
MDKNRLKKICAEMLNTSYNNKMKIMEFDLSYKHRYDDNTNEWKQDNYLFFFLIKKPDDYMETDEWRGIERFFESFFNVECIVEFR